MSQLAKRINRSPVSCRGRDGELFLNGMVGKLGVAVAIRAVKINLPLADEKTIGLRGQ